MDKIAELKRRFRDMMPKQGMITIDGVVTAITGDTCSVLVDDIELVDVRLKATANGKDSVLMVPVVGSHVLMISTDGSIDNLTVIKCDQVTKFLYNQNGVAVEIDSESKKISVKNDEINLYQLFEDLTMLLKTLKVSTPVGPSGVPLPDTIAKLDEFETNFKKLLK
ncbi:hypothetical protein BAS06_09470 [Elizabethkingia miricola]|uniref:hypothetical protein n=1 Tax=Elizabethkingia miricola TaxID=172045 RepID=UPI00099A449C|nr:hypothetical protein [Elizabethkingia miricola]MCT4181649.1 hypothetical protein [Elizabethkingia anophelis]MDV3880719.1 hypothetical protein [Elizabethkingia anophelis]OPB90537.1 hypothetical protein BAS06_09470 [Elizabethkingia miricola]